MTAEFILEMASADETTQHILRLEKKVAELEAELEHLKQVISKKGTCASEHFKKDYNYKLTTL